MSYRASSFESGTDIVHRNMTWAAKRRTTRQGDRAYALLDVPDVGMVVVYGRGIRCEVGCWSC
ncbi:hypothetical protein BV22DRAFT_1008107 [Leucogyrophana mollusca]|uniref:Uncharacterized protein n=1 Tax=Leucogyrophana mollusca TaxID=85980 RepID=A0ACB8BLY2_9AGAM|nr:hypothetical protein BV22DRAFT_1008107 [Leucogyrophana mollusca]